MNNTHYATGSLVLDFGSLARWFGFGSAGPIVSFGSAGSLYFSSLGEIQ